jgi:transposase InsO family protein
MAAKENRMPWKECSAMSSRLEFAELAQVAGTNIALLCRRFKIARKTAYKWIARYKKGGEAALADQSRRPHSSPLSTRSVVEKRIVKLRKEHPAWGGRKLKACLKALREPNIPAASTITAILRRHQLLDEERCAQAGPCRRFAYAAPNELWQMDFKGHVPLGGRSARCHPLTVLDDHSRYSLVLKACTNERGPIVRTHLIDAFRRYGLPLKMLMDNGGPWGAMSSVDRWTSFSLWLVRLGIQVTHGRPRHPQTQGKEERFHKTLVAEVLRWNHLQNLPDAQKKFDTWRRVYNHERPHEALQMRVPAQCYKPSPRSYPERLPEICYPADDVVRQVRHSCQIRLNGQLYHVGTPFVGQPVALRATRTDGLWDVYYAHQRLGQIDERRTDKRTLRGCRPLAALASDSPAG